MSRPPRISQPRLADQAPPDFAADIAAVEVIATAAAADAATAMADAAAVATSLADHEVAADPHTGYQKESEKGSANGYAGLDVTGKVPAAQLPATGAGVYAPGSTTLSDGQYMVMAKRLEMTGSERFTAEGTARLRVV